MTENTENNGYVPLHTNTYLVRMPKARTKPLYKRTEKALKEGDAQAVINSLTPLQKRFVEEYLVDFRGKDAVLRAGYRTKNPIEISKQLLKHPAILYAIDALKVERQMFTDVTKDYVLQKIVNTLEKAEDKDNHTAVLRAAELLAKHLGMFIERTEISGPDGKAIEIEKKTQEEAESFLDMIDRTSKRG